VDGRNPAPVNRWFIPLFIGFEPSKVVQDFFHPPYHNISQCVGGVFVRPFFYLPGRGSSGSQRNGGRLSRLFGATWGKRKVNLAGWNITWLCIHLCCGFSDGVDFLIKLTLETSGWS
jgi:hypothetical protein